MFDDRAVALLENVGPRGAVARAIATKHRRQLRAEQSANPGGLLPFIKHFWHLVEPGRKFISGWGIEAMCLHLEAVDRGEIQKLLITVPPGSMKSLLCSVFFPLWQWGPRNKPQRRFLNFSYSAHLTERDNDRMLTILQSREWAELWGPRKERNDAGRLIDMGFSLKRAGSTLISTNRTGWKLATSVGGVGTGERGDCVLLDDPHSIKDDRSEVVRPETVRWFKEAMSNRLNDMDTSVIIAIMQRSHEADVAGTIIEEDMGYVHLNIPMEYEPEQHCTTYRQSFENDQEPLWTDPRSIEGECFWSDRFPPKVIAELKKPSNAHVWISQYQQRPEPRGGAIIKRAYWQHYEVPTTGKRKGKWPEWSYMVASLDSAFTEKTENDPSGFTVWGVFQGPDGSMCAMLVHAWRKWLTLGGTKRIRPKLKEESWENYRQDTEKDWGIVHWMRYECARWKVDNLLIENKANGIDIFNELLKHAEHDKQSMTMIDPKNLDKRARLDRVQPTWAEGLIWARTDTKPARLTIDEMASAPRGKYRDITDTATQAIWYLRKKGYLEHVDVFKMRQERAQERAGKNPRGKKPLYGQA